jgi:hypothetical protein
VSEEAVEEGVAVHAEHVVAHLSEEGSHLC